MPDRDHDLYHLRCQRAASACASPGRVKGALHGVPLVVKDNTHVAGLPNSAATPALRAFVPRENAPTVQKLVSDIQLPRQKL